MLRPLRAVGAVFVLALAATGCAQMEAEERAADPSMQGQQVSLARFPGAEEQIRSYYEDHGQEGDYSCGPVDMGPILRVSKLSDTPTELRLAVHYAFSSEDDGGRSEYCRDGFNTRIVTFRKEGGALVFESMTGELGAA